MVTTTLWRPLCVFLLLASVANCFGGSLQYGDNCVVPSSSQSPPAQKNGTGTENPPPAEEGMCNVKETLTCQNGTCLCSDMSRMRYDTARGLCVGLAGHPCVQHPSESQVPSMRKSHCTPYASCENKTCTCWSAFYMEEDGHCSRRRGLMQQCSRDEQCDGRKGFICKDGLCNCDPQSSSYHPELERCVGLPGKPCVNMYRECVDNHKCKVGICTCKFKAVQGTDGTVKCDSLRHKYNKNCGKQRGSCGADLSCLNGKCRCPNPDYQIYDYEQRLCVSLVGGPCTVLPQSSSSSAEIQEEQEPLTWRNKITKRAKKRNKKKQSVVGKAESNSTVGAESGTSGDKVVACIPYARCLPYGAAQQEDISEGGVLMGRCECDKGYVETKKGRCNLPFGAACDTHSKNKRDICDESVPLYCVNNACACKNQLDVYEEESKKCKKSVGSLCWKDTSCVQNSRCVRYAPRLPGRCMCPPSSQPDPTSATCLSLYHEDASEGYDEEDDIEYK